MRARDAAVFCLAFWLLVFPAGRVGAFAASRGRMHALLLLLFFFLFYSPPPPPGHLSSHGFALFIPPAPDVDVLGLQHQQWLDAIPATRVPACPIPQCVAAVVP